jgi:hypothetical protein
VGSGAVVERDCVWAVTSVVERDCSANQFKIFACRRELPRYHSPP